MDLTLRFLLDLYAGVPGSIELVLEGYFALGRRRRCVKTEKGLDSGRGRRYVINRLVSRPFLSRESSFQAGIAQR